MAKAIRPTPILEGEDRRKFIEALKISYSSEKENFLNECRAAVKKIKRDV